jgi:hypothetical protein
MLLLFFILFLVILIVFYFIDLKQKDSNCEIDTYFCTTNEQCDKYCGMECIDNVCQMKLEKYRNCNRERGGFLLKKMGPVF